MIIVEQGKVAEICAEPGEFVYDSSTEPSIFSGNLGGNIIGIFKNIGKRFTFGGEAPKDEGVEDEKTANMLIEMGCDYLQGYYYSKPLSAEDFMNKFHSISADELF